MSQALTMVMAVVGGLGIFMLGMKYMSEGMQTVAGGSLRRMISLVTSNRVMATGTGTAVTLLVQSSSVTTVIVVGLVNAGLMQLQQAIGVMFGANIGTTITGWILVLKLGDYGLPLLGVAALVFVFARGDRPRYVAMAAMGLGMIFFGLELMKDGFAPMKDMPFFEEAFAWFSADTYLGVLKCVLVGCVLTLLVQSSSATLGITIGLAATGVIPFQTAAALVLGENIGTTITVLLASIGATTAARRAAYAHVLFNVLGVAWITAVFGGYIRLVGWAVGELEGVNPIGLTLAGLGDAERFAVVITAGIALTHTGFNVANTLLFLPFLGSYSRLLERLVPERQYDEVPRLRHLDSRSVDAPVLGIEQSRGEVLRMADGTAKMMGWIRDLAFGDLKDEELIRKVFHREQVLDNVQREIITFLTEVLDANVPHAIAEEGRQHLRLAHEYESIGDRLANILRSYLKLRDRQVELPGEQRQGLLALHDAVADFHRRVQEAYGKRGRLADTAARATSESITHAVRRLRDEQLQRMTDSAVDPNLSIVYTSLLTDYRRIRGHILNIHDATAPTAAI
ncbi:MAG TPA: Na/Pi cotransporter family protein [Thermoanaerobaculia bacterium]|nr:Na/Pi cotransporter family protein [Thermoanaerobaculia bacterium]